MKREGRPKGGLFVCSMSEGSSEPSRAAHRAMVAGFAAWFHAAGLLFLEIVYQFRHDSFLYTKLFKTRMR
jgi:hypothetical protein